MAAALHGAHGGPTLLVTARPGRARQLVEELRAWLPDPTGAVLFPEIEAFPYERLPVDPETAAARRGVLGLLAGAGGAGDGGPGAGGRGAGSQERGAGADGAADSTPTRGQATAGQRAASSAPTPLVVTSVRALPRPVDATGGAADAHA